MLTHNINKRHSRGFALIATISVMVLLVMIALAMLSLSTIELRQSGNMHYRQEAQANARMALMMAIGELQKSAGPDQRITAEAAILEEPTDNPAKIINRHWVGVWRSDAFKGEPMPGEANPADPIIYRNTDSSGSEAGSLFDRRAKEGDYVAKDQALVWLVSQRDSTRINPQTALPNDETTIRLVGPGSASISTEATDEVVAQRVQVLNDGKESGGYAWWVGDEGVKARFDLSSASEGLDPPQPWLSPAQQGVSIVGGYEDYEKLDDANLQKIITRQTSDLSEASTDAVNARRLNFHDITYSSNGLLTDTLRGGLRKDLSAFFAKGSAPDLTVGTVTHKGLESNTPILDSPKLKALSPQFGLLTQWNALAENNVSPTSAIDPIAPQNNATATQWSYGNDGDQHSGSGIDLSRQDTPGIHPIIIDAGISYGASISKIEGPNDDGETTYRFNIHYFPRVVLWNPYNVKLAAASYAVKINMPHKAEVHAVWRNNGHASADLRWTDTGGSTNYITQPVFSIQSTSFEPGEALLFTASAGNTENGNLFWGDGGDNLNFFKLSCKEASPLQGNFYFKLNRGYFKLKDDDLQDLAYRIEAQRNGVWKLYYYKLFLMKGNGRGIQSVVKNPSDYPPLQYINQTEDGSKGTDAPWFSGIPASATAPLRKFKDAPVHTYYRFKWGHRMQWLNDTVENQSIKAGNYNTPYLGYNTLANHNMRAGWHIVSPVEVKFRASAAAGRYTHGILIDDPYGWNWYDSSLDPVPVKGKNRVSPFGRSANFSGQTFPILDVPSKTAPLTSLAALQHAPLSQFPWHPTNAVGNSLVDPRVPRTQSTHFVSAGQWKPIGVHNPNPDRWHRIRQGHLNAELDNSAFLYDLSYETNLALWDRYYLSTVPKSAYSIGDPLANPRLQISTDSGKPKESDLQDFHQSAKYLRIKGAFNINSTSEKAWAALIASLRADPGMSITLQNGTKIEANDVYSRFFHPYNLKYENNSETDEKTWKGYRQLTDTQIRNLAKEIVKEVKQRGPFISLADFVNRRLVEPPETSGSETPHSRMGLKGALQAAIDRTSINSTLLTQHVIDKTEYNMGGNPREQQINYGSSYPQITYPLHGGNSAFGSKPDHNHWADSKMVGAPSFLTQADMLQKWGNSISARSDTFTIRAYGDAKDAKGVIRAKAWCEATVQRIQKPIVPDAADLDPETDLQAHPETVFGRKFKIISFRWLNQKEI